MTIFATMDLTEREVRLLKYSNFSPLSYLELKTFIIVNNDLPKKFGITDDERRLFSLIQDLDDLFRYPDDNQLKETLVNYIKTNSFDVDL